MITQSLSSRFSKAFIIGLYWANCKSNIFFHQNQRFILGFSLWSKLSSIYCSIPTFHLYHTKAELAHWEDILKKLNNICIQKKIQTTSIIRIHGMKLKSFLLFFCRILSQNRAMVIIVHDISTVQYHNIEDHIIHRINHQIIVVNETQVNILSFLMIAYGRATSISTYIIIQKNPISV